MTTKTTNQTDKFFKAALQFVSKETYRPVLQGVYFKNDGSMVATDSFQLIKIENAHSESNPFIKDKKSQHIEGTYPDTSRLIPQRYDILLTVDVQEWLQAAELMDVLHNQNKKNESHGISLDIPIHADPVISVKKEGIGSGKQTLSADGFSSQDFHTHFDARYFINSLKAFKTLGFKTVDMEFTSKNSPIVFKAGNVTALIMPIRKEK